MIVNPFIFGPVGAPSVGTDILWMADADHENSANEKFLSGSTGMIITSGATGANGKVYNATTFNSPVDFPAAATRSAGMRFKIRTDANGRFLYFQDTNTVHVALGYLVGGSIEILRNTTQLDVTAGGLFSLDTWYYAVVVTTINDTTGSVTAYLYEDNGTLIDTLTFAGDTRNGANSTTNRNFFGGTANDTYMEGCWVGTGAVFAPPWQIETTVPNGNGDTSGQWSRIDGDSGADYTQVNENPRSGSFSLSSTAADQVALFTFPDLVLSGDILGVQITAIANDISASPQFKLIAKVGGVIYEGATHTVGTAGLQGCVQCWTNNPATGNAWTAAEFNAAQFGMKSVTADVEVLQVACEVMVQI